MEEEGVEPDIVVEKLLDLLSLISLLSQLKLDVDEDLSQDQRSERTSKGQDYVQEVPDKLRRKAQSAQVAANLSVDRQERAFFLDFKDPEVGDSQCFPPEVGHVGVEVDAVE